jgi:hypothetical protein
MSSAPAGALSLAQIGFKAFGDVEKGMGTQAADEYQAVWLERAAEYGRLLAKQAGAQMTERLVATLDHIDAVQSARHVDLTSPSAVAVREHGEFVGERGRKRSRWTSCWPSPSRTRPTRRICDRPARSRC